MSLTFFHNDMKIVLDIFSEDWDEVKKAALTTIHKKFVPKEITKDWKEAMVVGRHSPIREFRIKVKIEDIPRWIADQLVRHNVGVNNYMGTMRPDRGNVPRSEQPMTMPTVFQQTYNIDSFLTMCYARSCVGCVSKETRMLVEAIIAALDTVEPEIARYCVPPCVHLGGCKERLIFDMTGAAPCNHYKTFVASSSIFSDVDLQKRHTLYHSWKS